MSAFRRAVFHRVAAVLGVAALLAATGCDNTVSGAPVGPPPSLELKPTGESAEEGETEAGFDECSLVDPEEAAELLGVDRLYVTSREALTLTDGSRKASCTYFPEDEPGTTGMIIGTIADTDPARFFAPFEKNENVLPLQNLGDRAEAIGYSARGTSVHFYEFRVIEGDSGIHVLYTYRKDGKGPMPDLAGQKGMATILRNALERIPDDLTIPDGAPEGPCADIDLDAASEVLGDELETARSVVNDDGGAHCHFSNTPVRLTVTVVTSPDRVTVLSVPQEEITHQDIGEGARVRFLQGEDPAQAGPLDATVNLDDAVLLIGAKVKDAAASAEPGPEELDLVRAIVDAVGARA